MSISNNDRMRSRDGMGSMIRLLVNRARGIRICHINAQSLKPKIEEFRYIFENSGVDVICVSETWLRPEIADSSILLQGYNVRRVDRNGYGGVAIYVRKGIAVKILCKSIAEAGCLLEYLILEICFEGRKLLVGCVYRPNSRVCIEGFMDTLQSLTVSYDDVIVTGDFNSNILVNPWLKDNMLTIGLASPNTTNATHFTGTSSTLLDLFFVSDLSMVLLYDQLSASCFSRHDLIFMTYNFHLSLPEQIIEYRDFRNIDYNTLEVEFSSMDWYMLYGLISVDDQLSFLNSKIQRLYDMVVPLRTKRINGHNKPWFTQDIRQSICNRDHLYARWKRFRTTELYGEYRLARRMTNSLIKRAKSEYYARKFSAAMGSKKTWQTIREIGINRSGIEDLCGVDSNDLNEKFLNIPNVPPIDNYYNFSDDTSCNTFSFVNVTQCDVLSSVRSIKSNAIGVDGMDPRFLKILIPKLLPLITFIFNKILTTSCYPKIWKLAKIVPIPKSNSDYRPIAILPFLSKVFERLIQNQITRFLEAQNLFTSRQSGFRKNNSCITALVDVAEDIRQQVDCGNVTFLVLLDHSRAFDTVDHNVLSLKLRYMFRFESSAINLMCSYLSDRYQYVQTSTSKSRCLPLSRGVPQGSILGPLLFSLYVNDLPCHLQHCKIRLYADDVQLYISCGSTAISECVTMLNQELDRVYRWATANGLQINPTKSKCLIIKKRLLRLDCDPILILNNQPIEVVQSARNLGISFNDTLTWSNHIKIVCGRTFSMLRNLWQTQYCTPIRIRVLLAKSYLVPILLYGCEIFVSCDSDSKRKLNVAFNNIVRYVYGLRRYDHVSTYVNLLYGMSFDNYLKVRTLLFMHRIIHTHQPQHLYERLQFSTLARGRRLLAFAHRSLVSKYQFFIHAISLWNAIPHRLQVISDARQFRRNIICHFSNVE